MTSLYEEYPVESLMQQYPYGAAMGCDAITLFHGDDYGVILPAGPNGYGFGWNLFNDVLHTSDPTKDIGHFVSNAVKTAGREIGHVANSIQDAVGKVTHAIAQVPIIGGLVTAVFDIAYHSVMGVINIAVTVIEHGGRIDKAIMSEVKQMLQDFKQVAPYAQMVISVIPGIGPVASAALSAGLALAEGQPITDVLKAGLIGMLPGGPLVKAAVTMGVETIQHVAKGEKVDVATLAQTAGGIASSALGLPLVAKNALMAGISTMGAVIHGQPLDKAVTDGAIAALPIPRNTKDALTQASGAVLDLAHGKSLDHVLMNRINAISSMLPVDNQLRQAINGGLDTLKNVAQGQKAEQVMYAAMQSGLGDTLTSVGAQALPDDVKKAIKSGISLGSGVVAQARRADQLLQKVPGKLIEGGIQLAKTSPLFGEARRIAGTATQGFDTAAGLVQQQAKLFDIATMRNALPAPQKIGFDLALATRIGAVSNPRPAIASHMSAAAHAGHSIAMGMQSYSSTRKQAMMVHISKIPSAAVGAKQAIKEVALKRETWIRRLLKALHLIR